MLGISSRNPANPDPTQSVNWGPQTFNEMMIGYVETYRPLSESNESAEPGSEGNSNGLVIGVIFRQMDRNDDGKVQEDEIPEARRQNLMRLDTNKEPLLQE